MLPSPISASKKERGTVLYCFGKRDPSLTNFLSASFSEKLELQKLAFIPVANGTRLVSVKSLFARLTINLSPFAFELPSRYLPFVALLREIGMQESLTNSYARELLLDIQKACGYQRLNPNELRAVMEILDFMCSGVNHNTSDGSEGCYDSVIPDDGCRLVSAASCVYVDPYGSHLLSNINTSRLRFAHSDLPQNICKGLGIKRLSDVIVEVYDKEMWPFIFPHLSNLLNASLNIFYSYNLILFSRNLMEKKKLRLSITFAQLL
jgi:hypothetical protein